MKLMLFGLDGASYNFIVKHLKRFDFFEDLMARGAYAKMDQSMKSSGGMYTSMDIWTTMYCGLHPAEHKLEGAFMRDELTGKKCVRKLTDLEPCVQKKYFWNILNARGYRVGLYNGMMFNPAFEVDGFVYGTYPNINGVKYYPANIEKYMQPVLAGNVAPHQLKKYDESEITAANVNKIHSCMGDTYYYHGVTQLFSECMANYNTLVDIMEREPVDMLFFYATNLDIIQHFQYHQLSEQALIESYQMLEMFMKRLVDKYMPENIIIVSDHGFTPSKDGPKPLNCNACLSVGGNGGILSGSHADDAILIMEGTDITERHQIKANMTYVYNKILEILN